MTAESLAGFLTAAGYSHERGSNASLSDSLEWIFALESTRPFVDWLSDKLLQEPGLPFALDKSPGHTVHYNGLEILSKEESECLKTHRRMEDSLDSRPEPIELDTLQSSIDYEELKIQHLTEELQVTQNACRTLESSSKEVEQAMYDVVLNNRKLDLEIAKLETELLYKKNKGIEMSNQMDVLLEKTCEVTLDSARKVVDSSSKHFYFHLDSSSELTTKHVTSEIARVSRHLNSMTDALSFSLSEEEVEQVERLSLLNTRCILPRIQSDIENEELNKKLEHLKSIPLPENCLVMDHYTSMESRLELRAKIKEIYAEIQELLPSLSLLQVSEALFNNFLNTGGKALDIIGAEMTNIHDGVTAFTNLTDEVTEALSSERNRTLAFTTLFELQWETLLEWKRDARVLKEILTNSTEHSSHLIKSDNSLLQDINSLLGIEPKDQRNNLVAMLSVKSIKDTVSQKVNEWKTLISKCQELRIKSSKNVASLVSDEQRLLLELLSESGTTQILLQPRSCSQVENRLKDEIARVKQVLSQL